ncbi:MAG: FimV family protein [Burkholderiales bacterium]|nr:FimV family protein [Burkholderiales bacterium]
MKRKNLFNALLIAGLLVAPFTADAAGLGKLKVISALGQPLRAEIELISVPKDEVDLLTARIATVDAYKQAKIERQEGLTNVRFAVAKRSNGEPYLLISSIQAFNEPFLDLLIQLDWPTGRLLREYTILLDPPGFQEKSAAPVINVPVAKAEPAVKPAPAPVIAEKPMPAAPLAEPAKVEKKAKPEKPIKPEKVAPEKKVAEKPTDKKSAKPAPIIKAEPTQLPRPLTPAEQTFPRFEGDRELPALAESAREQAMPIAPALVAAAKPARQEHTVKKGDSLSKIAREMKPEGYSLEQMMVALYENNKNAFDGNNMNRLKSGQILRAPEKVQLDSTGQSTAAKEIKAHTADWNAYRQKLAGAVAEQQPAKAEAKPEAAGKITAKAEDKAAKPQEPAKDVLKLSKGETADQSKGAGAAGKGAGAAETRALQEKLTAAQDDAVAKEKAFKEAGSRITDLEKNVKEMQALLELKNKQMAELEKQAKAKPIAPPVVAQVEPPKSEVKPEPVKEAAAPAAPGTPVEPLVKAVPEQAKPEEPKPAPQPKLKPVPQPEPETSFMDTVMGNPLYMGGGAAAVVGGLFAGLWALGRRRKKSLASFEDSIMTGGGDLKTNTVFGNTAGGQIDTGDTSFLTDFSQAGMGAIDTNDVDPIAEAEVYMAYGRDAQAEEILKEAMSKDPNRHEIQLKLLEIYAGRKNIAAFETLAGELYAATSGQGPVWEKAAEFGRGLDAANPLYAAPEGKGEGAGLAAAAVAGTAFTAASVAPDLDFSLDLDTQGGVTSTPAANEADQTLPEAMDEAEASMSDTLDFDLDTVIGKDIETPPLEVTQEMATLDFDLDTIIPQAVEKQADTPAERVDLGGDTLTFDLPEMELETPEAAKPAADKPEEALALDFDFNLEPDAAPATTKPVAAEAPMMPDLDLSGISLDLGDTTAPSAADFGGSSLEDATTLAGDGTVWEEASTKLDLARAYLEMGDKEGAREILQEVVSEGGPDQQEDAKKLLATLS